MTVMWHLFMLYVKTVQRNKGNARLSGVMGHCEPIAPKPDPTRKLDAMNQNVHEDLRGVLGRNATKNKNKRSSCTA